MQILNNQTYYGVNNKNNISNYGGGRGSGGGCGASHSQSKERTGYDNLLHTKKFNTCAIFLFAPQKYHGIWMKSDLCNTTMFMVKGIANINYN